METKGSALPDAPPLTLEEMGNWLHRLEEMAALQRDVCWATWYILLNFITQLSRQGFNGEQFLAALTASAERLEQDNQQQALGMLLDEFRAALNWQAPSSDSGDRH